MTTVSLGVKDTLAKMLDAVPAKKRQFLRTRVMRIRQKTETKITKNVEIVGGRMYIASAHRTV